MKFKDTDVSVHKPVDSSDPGFAVKGYKLRWISSQVESRRAGRIWTPLKASMLPDSTLKRLKDQTGSWFSQGDTIRRKDLTLAFAPMDQVEERRRTLQQNQRANEAVFRGKVDMGNGISTERDNQVTAERTNPSEQFG